MATKLVRIFAASAAAAALLTPTASYAQADSAASVTKGQCGLGKNVSGLSEDLTGAGTRVITSSGKSNLTCHFVIPAGLEPDRPVKKSGFGCMVNGHKTTNSSVLMTPGGTATLSCKV